MGKTWKDKQKWEKKQEDKTIKKLIFANKTLREDL